MGKLIPILILLFSCGSAPIVVEELDSCDQTKYHLIWNIDVYNPSWRMEYLDYVSLCMEDSNKVIQLAKKDGEMGSYTFIIYGMVAHMDPFENIYKKYPIGFHCPGCESKNSGIIYNRELKKYLKLNEGLDYDSIMAVEFDNE